ncbi:MAG: hypothetical protein I3273_07090 [Candidatus Moeniiplasma glomeromycotorum]|nr:hypothetical protein [Candidatus Moeniiplasma glomeromycotorum]MCE8168491.1 hypothetical protein [Candidatus Moeniiplasma glomeromycotorum]MCE8169851.1 hypothetical protein [Candidatus Moeniiplasma glomeromycotorum]
MKNNTKNPSSTSNSNKAGIYIGLTIGGIVLGGIIIYFLMQKKKKVANKS